MELLCYNTGCGQRFDPARNSPDSCVFHPGVPIFHDALKGWSCCKKRTTDFSEFLAIKGCTKGYHSKEKPPQPLSREETSEKPKAEPAAELIVQGPASAERRQRERPSSDEPRQLLPIKASRSLQQALEKLELRAQERDGEGSGVRAGTACKNAACKAIYQGPDSDADTCTFHPGVPVFHEGMKYWSCCAVKSTDFGAFLEQPGCSSGRHCWEQKRAASCRHDWHQTGSHVVLTVYARNPLPALSTVKANRTVLEVHVVFEGDKVFQAELELWGVIDTGKSFVSMVPTKVEVTLSKASAGRWAALQLPPGSPRARGDRADRDPAPAPEPRGALDDDSDDGLSWSEDEDEDEEMGRASLSA
ncbi:integrin beta-1-binding protein 2 [Nothoprocta perdicaria]|uniref:integrin beta-1-binding protein 2 n=1 Tax=Nothoprocta perdicaria TaxID=30464 RepID=UPI000E1C02DB|nr:integrin beta-1-binding protein 2 [Nothoprocta perdicaria]